jgi:hypothetical protein
VSAIAGREDHHRGRGWADARLQGKLTDDDITQINGDREQLEGIIQARYGYAKDQIKKEVDDWADRL